MGVKRALGKTLTSPSYSLIDSFKELINNDELSDVQFVVGDEKKKVYAHKVILAARCEVFRAMFADKSLKAGETVPLILPDIKPGVFYIVLEYLYTGSFTLNQDVVVDVLATSIEYGLEELRKMTLEYIYDTVSVDNACSLLQAAVTYRQDELEDYCFKFIEDNTADVLRSKAFVEMSESTLRNILRSDKLTADEYTILQCVKEWGTVNSVVLGQSLGQVLKHVVEFVRFPLLKQNELQECERENEDAPYVPMRLISYAWRSHALKERDPDNPQTRPRIGSSI